MKPYHRSPKGTDFRTTDESLQRVLDELRVSRTRVKLTYDGAFGNYGENHDSGYIGRTMGNPNYANGGVKAPILLKNSRSRGGCCLLDDHIIKVETSKGHKVLWTRE